MESKWKKVHRTIFFFTLMYLYLWSFSPSVSIFWDFFLVLASQITAILKCQCILCVCSLSSPVDSLRHSFFDLCSSLTAGRIWVIVVLSKPLWMSHAHQSSYYEPCQEHLIHLSLISYDTKLHHCFLIG